MPLDFLYLNQPWEPGLLGKLIPVAEQAIEPQIPCAVFKPKLSDSYKRVNKMKELGHQLP
jgi:hypothetical protein